MTNHPERGPALPTVATSTAQGGLMSRTAGADNLRGIVLMLIAGLLFAGMQAGVREAGNAGVHPFEIAFFRVAFGLFVVLPWFVRHGLAVLRTEHLGLHCLRALLDGTSMLAWFVALMLAPLAQITALGFTAPIFATLFAMAFLGERVRLRRWSAILAGFLGAIVVVRPGFAEIGLGPALALASTVGHGAVILIVRVLGRTEPSITTTAWFSLLMMPVTLIPAAFFWTWPDPATLLVLLGVGIAGNLGQIAFVQALRIGETAVVMPFDFVKLFWVAALAFLLFGQVPDGFTWAGGALIFAAGAYIAYRERRPALKGTAAVPPEPPATPR